jgi:hypothetical protein
MKPDNSTDEYDYYCTACRGIISPKDRICPHCGADTSEFIEEKEEITKDIWQQKSDEELITVSEHLSEYTEEAEEIIRAELQRRRMPEPEPTVRTFGVEQSEQPTNSKITIGIIILIIGIALIIISPSLLFVEAGRPSQFDPWGWGNQRITDLRNVARFFGAALLIVGGIISAVGFSQFMSTQPTPPPAPTTQPVVTQSASPKSVEIGNTTDEIQSVMGQPDKIINLGARVIHVYKDMKIIYVDGKVSDVQLS